MSYNVDVCLGAKKGGTGVQFFQLRGHVRPQNGLLFCQIWSLYGMTDGAD